ncbi:hypothetical protein, partial [Shewanella xiamenensis]|uniref:hypothetical protein n=1 Tax=Shewanella xiamenensis TaxID=332186 RepID=UPI00313D26C3
HCTTYIEIAKRISLSNERYIRGIAKGWQAKKRILLSNGELLCNLPSVSAKLLIKRQVRLQRLQN